MASVRFQNEPISKYYIYILLRFRPLQCTVYFCKFAIKPKNGWRKKKSSLKLKNLQKGNLIIKFLCQKMAQFLAEWSKKLLNVHDIRIFSYKPVLFQLAKLFVEESTKMDEFHHFSIFVIFSSRSKRPFLRSLYLN